ncbi:MAG: DUF3408 domain-containing protein [Taibaiella sp.]|nr:DUF3408 domain-containing protein [Taibaiella sp.]
MEKDNKKKVTPDINEELMMNLMVDGVKTNGLQNSAESIGAQESEATNSGKVNQEEKSPLKPVQRERQKAKKNLEGNYGERFLRTHSMTKRGDKSIYIRQEYHERLSRIVQVIGKDEIPLYAYLDNILEHHFEMFEKEITDDFNEKFKPIF